jgi:WD40 repeat protein
MSRSPAESHRCIKLITAEFDRLLTRLRSFPDGDRGAVVAELVQVTQSARRQPDLSEWAAFLDAHTHLIARGGALGLLQTAVGLANSSLVSRAAEEWALGRSWKVNWFRRTQRPPEWAPGAMLRYLELRSPRPWSVALSPDASRLISLSVDGLISWSLAEGTSLAVALPKTRPPQVLARLDDGQGLLLGLADGSVERWSVDPLATRERQAGHQGAILAIEATSTHAATLGVDGQIILWGLGPLKKLATFRPERPARAIGLGPGHVLAGDAAGMLTIYPFSSEPRTVQAHLSPINRVLSHLDGERAFTASNDRSIRIWSLETGEQLGELRGHRGPISHLALDATGERLLSGGVDDAALLWSLPEGRAVAALPGHSAGVSVLRFGSNGQLFTGSNEGLVRAFGEGGEPRGILGIHEGPVAAVVPLEQAVLSTGLDGSAQLWPLPPPPPAPPVPAPAPLQLRTTAGLDPEGQRAVCVSTAGEVELWDLSEARKLRRITTLEGNQRLAASLLERGLVLLDAGRAPLTLFESVQPLPHRHTLRLVEAEQGETVHTLDGHRMPVRTATIDPKGKLLATGDAGGEIRLWNLQTGELVHTLAAHKTPILSLAFEAEGAELISLAGAAGESVGEVFCWTVRSGKLARRLTLLPATDGPATQLRPVPGVREIVLGTQNGQIARHDLDSGKRTKIWAAHEGEIRALALDEEGSLVASAGDDRQIKLWRRSTGKLLARYDSSARASGLLFLPDGRLAATFERGEPHHLKFVDWGMED